MGRSVPTLDGPRSSALMLQIPRSKPISNAPGQSPRDPPALMLMAREASTATVAIAAVVTIKAKSSQRENTGNTNIG